MVLLTREQLEERLAALHRASLELVSDVSRNNVLERIARLAREQADAEFAAIAVLGEDGQLEKFIHMGVDEKTANKIGHPPRGLGLLGALMHERKSIRIPDIVVDPRSAGFPAHHPAMHSFLGVPVIAGKMLLGQIYLTNKKNGADFTGDDQRVIETLAAYAAVAIENSRLYENVVESDRKLKEQFEDMMLLYNLAKTSVRAAGMDDILDETLTQVVAHFDVSAGEIFLCDDSHDMLWLKMHRGEASDAFWSCDRFRFGEGIIGQAAAEDRSIESPVLEKDVVCLRPALIEAGFRRIICVPLRAGNRVVGVMTVASHSERHLTWRERELLDAIGTWAGTAIENARLQQQSRRIAILEERERIGMDLHDGVIQSIYAVGLALDYARMSLDDDIKAARQKISESIEGLNSTIQDIRAYVLDLRPRQLRGGETLTRGIQRLLDEFRHNTNTKTHLATNEDGLASLPRQNALALFHICQEALANVAKHARAEEVDVQLWTADEQALLKISDNGRGFTLEDTGELIGHGLSNMHRRARKVGGDVDISSTPEQGTTISAWVPWKHLASVPQDELD